MFKTASAAMLTECGITVDTGYYSFLDEAAQVSVTDSTLTEMFKFITNKYNSIDFSEIERSAGDYTKFKYRALIQDNVTTLRNIYEASVDPGAKKYLEVIEAIEGINSYLSRKAVKERFSFLYKKGVGLIQVLYTSMVAGMLYSVTVLITNTIRFVTSEEGTDMEVLFEEIPITMKSVHIRNVLAIKNDLDNIDEVTIKLYNSMAGKGGPMTMKESVETFGAAVVIVAGIIFLIPKIITLIREIIYSIYYARVKVAEAIDIQVHLIRVNIESLEMGRGNKKVIASQKKIAEKLNKLARVIEVKMDAAEPLMKTTIKAENQSLKIDKNSEMYGSTNTSGLML